MTSQTKKAVLVCDDEKGIRESLKLILSGGYDLTFAENGVEALEALKSMSPAAVLLDIKMPKLHGLEILKEIKKLRPALPVIIVTGYQSAEIAQESIRAGAADYIPKPFDAAKILETLAAVTGK